jgi:hypothetical protein
MHLDVEKKKQLFYQENPEPEELEAMPNYQFHGFLARNPSKNRHSNHWSLEVVSECDRPIYDYATY